MLNKVAGVMACGAFIGMLGVAAPAYAADDSTPTVTVDKLTAVSANEATVAVSFTCPKNSDASYTVRVSVLDSGKDKDGKKTDTSKLVYAEGVDSGSCDGEKGTAEVKAGIPKTSGGSFTEGKSYIITAELFQDVTMSKSTTLKLDPADTTS
ncbi:hypothetical protein [Nocardia sp. NPDC051570]|uniref:hypothetical protein n=1 Tax=Nocardia sp. NPDC051570 TaxID=3364324 RepID=UPI003795BC1A